MEEKTSFIPKGTLAKPVYQKRGSGFLVSISFFLFFISAAMLGGVYFYKNAVQANIDLLSDSLKKTREILDMSFVEKISKVDNKIEKTKALLEQHKVITPLFEFLEQSTVRGVRFNSFDLSIPVAHGEKPTLNLRGNSKSYNSLALEAEELQKNKNVEGVSFSGFSLGDKGLVNFSSVIEINPSFFLYKNKQN